MNSYLLIKINIDYFRNVEKQHELYQKCLIL